MPVDQHRPPDQSSPSPAADFGAGAAPAPPAPASWALRTFKALLWLLLGLLALLLAAAALLWHWAGSEGSLATTLVRAAQHLPAGQQLQSRGVSGSLRSGGRVDWLRWSSPGLAIEVSALDLRWQLAPLLQGRLEIDAMQAARVQITPQGASDTAPPTPLTQLPLPLHVGLPFHVAQLQWAGSPAVQAQGLAGDYRFDGRQHRLRISAVEIAQGRYSASATLDAQAPMALSATLDGQLRSALPGGGADLPLSAQASLQGTLATAAAQLQLQARISPISPLSSADAAPPRDDSVSQERSGQSAAPDKTPSRPATMQADVQASLAPWAPQPLQSASATLRAVNLAALWPQAPVTLLHGSLQATPGAAALWSLQAQLRNDLAGPWDRSRLPLSAVQASASYDGTSWSVPGVKLDVGGGSATAQGRYSPATGALEGQAELRALRPDALHSALAAAPLSGRVSARMQGAALRFDADIRAAADSAAPKPGPTPLRIERFSAQGAWQAAPATPSAGTLHIEHLLLDALQARIEATALRLTPGAQSAQGRVALSVPGVSAQAQGQIAPRAGKGQLHMQWSDPGRSQRWLGSLPWVGVDIQRALQGINAQGAAQLDASWQGGWQTLVQQAQAVIAGAALPAGQDAFELQAKLDSAHFDLRLPPGVNEQAAAGPLLQLRAVKAELSGSLAQARVALDGELRSPLPSSPTTTQTAQTAPTAQVALHGRLSGGMRAAGQWQWRVAELRLQAQDPRRPGPWALQLAEPVSISARTRDGSAAALAIETSSGQARLTGPLPGTVALRWQPLRWAMAAGAPPQLQSRGTLQGLPMAWVDALGLDGGGGDDSAGAGQGAAPLLARLGLSSDIVLDGQWDVERGERLRASASLHRASGELRLLAGDLADTPALPGGAKTQDKTGVAAGVRQAEVGVAIDGEDLRAHLLWTSERAGDIDASLGTRLRIASAGKDADSAISWPANAPLAGQLRARLPDIGLWSALAPPGWRVRGTLSADASLSGTRDAPRWAGTLGADDLALRSLLDGVDLQGGRLRATLQGQQIEITELRLQGGRGSKARIAGFSGNRTAAPQDGGALTGSGLIRWSDDGAAGGGGLSGISFSMQAEASALQVLVRADRQVSVSGRIQAQLQQGQISLRAQLRTDRATIILPDESAPSLGADVVVRSAATRQAAKKRAAQAQTAKPPDITIGLDLGQDFALQGQGITTRLTGAIEIRSSAQPGAPPRVTGEVRTEEGRYRAWGQMLDVETGLIRFNGAYDNPALDILALRPNISVRAGVQISGTALAPRVKLYADPDLPDAEKLSWVVLGRNTSAGGAEAAVLQQAALALLSRNGSSNTTANIAKRLGLDEIGFRGPAAGQDASAAALTFGKRLSKDLYVTYERSLSGTLGTLYIFYDLSRRLTLRGQTGEKSALDIIYTMNYD